MVSRRPAGLTGGGSGGAATTGGPVGAATPRVPGQSRINVYSAQTFANFCEVDLKTVHHWADRGKIPHFRTDGRHLRFRRNDVVRFLRSHGYPLPEALVRARPTVALALGASMLEAAPLSLEDLAKRLGSRFAVKRHGSGLAAIAHLLADTPDVLVLSLDDPTIGFPSALKTLKEDASTSWVCLAAFGADEALSLARDSGAEVALPFREVTKLAGELARALAVA